MKTLINAEFQIITPLFLGGADPKHCELRPSTLKGALVFWWRSLQKAESHEELRKRETELFGGSETGRSRLSLDVRWKPGYGFDSNLTLESGRAYLAGQGLWNIDRLTRGFAKPGGSFTVRAVLKQAENSQDLADILNAFRALGLCGGLGARSRRGFGSLRLERLQWESGAEDGPEAIDDFQKRLQKLAQLRHDQVAPEYSAFSSESRMVLLVSNRDAEQTHEKLGEHFHDFRSCRPFDGDPKPLAVGDKRVILHWLQGQPLAQPPRRAVFGLPHNYYLRRHGGGGGTSVEIEPPSPERGRRASPLFFHIDEIGPPLRRQGVVIATFLPSTFLPADEKIRAKVRNGPEATLKPIPPPALWQPILDYLDDLAGQPGAATRRIP